MRIPFSWLLGLACLAGCEISDADHAAATVALPRGVVTITKENFQAVVLASPAPVLVDFGATWCGPCQELAPLVDRSAEQYAGRLVVGKVDVDEQPDLAGDFQVDSFPTLLMFHGGQLVDKLVGAPPEADLIDFIERHVQPAAQH